MIETPHVHSDLANYLNWMPNKGDQMKANYGSKLSPLKGISYNTLADDDNKRHMNKSTLLARNNFGTSQKTMLTKDMSIDGFALNNEKPRAQSILRTMDGSYGKVQASSLYLKNN